MTSSPGKYWRRVFKDNLFLRADIPSPSYRPQVSLASAIATLQVKPRSTWFASVPACKRAAMGAVAGCAVVATVHVREGIASSTLIYINCLSTAVLKRTHRPAALWIGLTFQMSRQYSRIERSD